MGIGIGGDYPISAVISSEFSSVHIRGRVMAAVFANQGWGQLCEPHRPVLPFTLVYLSNADRFGSRHTLFFHHHR